MMFNINPMREKDYLKSFFSFYHLDKLITRIDEIKFIEKTVVDQKHDLTTRRFGICCGVNSIDDNELSLNKLVDDESSSNFFDNNNPLFELFDGRLINVSLLSSFS